MARYCKKFMWLSVSGLLLIVLVCSPSICVGQEGSNDVLIEYPDGWVLTTYYALRQPGTTLEWGACIGVWTHALGMGYIPTFYTAETDWVEDLNTHELIEIESVGRIYSGGYTDWRPPTVGEVIVAVENGLLEHLDLRAYADGLNRYPNEDYGPDSWGLPPEPPDPEGVNLMQLPYWALCIEKNRGGASRYKFVFDSPDGDGLEYWMESGGAMLMGVRGAEPDHSNCPGKHYKPPKDK